MLVSFSSSVPAFSILKVRREKAEVEKRRNKEKRERKLEGKIKKKKHSHYSSTGARMVMKEVTIKRETNINFKE